jgi:hypothetical protein
MAKKNKKILPNSKVDRLPKSTDKKLVQKNTKQQKKTPINKKGVKKPTKKVVQKTKKTVKKVPSIGGFSKNNFNYIRSLLWREFRTDFPSYFDPSFIRLVREIFNDCKAAGVNCTEEIIKSKYEQLRSDDKRPKPYILPYFQQPKVYYEIKDVPFPTLAPYLYVVSPMILSYPHEFRITEYFKKKIDSRGVEELEIKGYDKFFGKWVNWCNSSMRNEHGNVYDSDELEIFFKMSDAEYNEDKKRWETYIYTCTSMGAIFDFGYKPEGVLEKDYDPEYKLPSDNQISEEPIEEKEKGKIKRITRKQKINDAINTWDNFFSSVKKSKEKSETEKFAQDLEELSTARKELEKLIRKYKREKNTRKLKEVNKEYDLLTSKYLKLTKQRFK